MLDELRQARADMVAVLGDPPNSFRTLNRRVTVTGVGILRLRSWPAWPRAERL